MTIQRPEPAFSSDEVTMLRGFIDHYRATIRLQASGLSAAQLDQPLPPSDLTLGGMLKHLAFVEDYTTATKLSGSSPGEPWEAADWDSTEDWDFTSAAEDTPGELYALYDGAVERSRARLAAALADGGLDQLVDISGPDGQHASLRRLVCDLIEEYGRHAGHADLLREAVDGLVGEDPPAGWRP